MTVGPTWQPGDPLYPQASRSYRTYFFNFRSDTDSERCNCGDAAGWPEPRGGFGLNDGDEIGDFIAWYRAHSESIGAVS